MKSPNWLIENQTKWSGVSGFLVLSAALCVFTDRQVLDSRYGLKRWQIGEVASKIGQLYYHY